MERYREIIRARQAAKSDSARGFTLFELLVVMVVMGLMIALAWPRMARSLEKMNLNTAARKMSAALRYARSKAVSQSTTYISDFDFDSRRLTIKPLPEKTRLFREGSVSNNDKATREKSYELPEGVRLEKAIVDEEEIRSGLFRIVFFPSGCSSGGEVVITGEKKDRYRIKVDFITGMVELEAL